MRKLIFTFCLLMLCAAGYAAPVSIAVLDFETGDLFTAQEAAIMTDAFRNEMVASGRADIVDRAHTEALKGEMTLSLSDWNDPKKIKSAGRFLSVDYIIFGSLKGMEGKGYLQVQMTEVETGKNVYSSQMLLAARQDFDLKVSAFAKEFIKKIPSQSTFAGDGIWAADIVHDNLIDSYLIDFTGTNRCKIQVTSTLPDGDVTEEAVGTYSFDGDILKINAVFRNSKIPHIKALQWQSVISMQEGGTAFNMVVKPVSGKNTQVRATFTKE